MNTLHNYLSNLQILQWADSGVALSLEEVVSYIHKPVPESGFDNTVHPPGGVVINALHQIVALCEEKPQKEVSITLVVTYASCW